MHIRTDLLKPKHTPICRGTIFTMMLIVLVVSSLAMMQGVNRSRDLNVLLISLDTTRADRLGCYSYDKAKTSNLDGLAAKYSNSDVNLLKLN